MVKIRLRRVGATKRPMYRIVAADSRAPRDGRFLETLGHYNPLTEPATVVVKEERVRYWVEHGAQPTDVVVRLLAPTGVLAARGGQAPAAAEAPPAPEALALEATPAEAPAAEIETPKRTRSRRKAAASEESGGQTEAIGDGT